MISRNTVLVLGAGASMPYGFSSGRGLLNKARRVSDVRLLMGDAGKQITQAQSIDIVAALKDTMLPSIDALLEHRQDLWPVGKRLIAAMLFAEERTAKPPEEDDWMSLVFTHMAEGASSLEQFGRNPITFVTFNYDRYLEYRMVRSLMAHYHVDAKLAWDNLKAVGFVHLHGSLGKLPEQTRTEHLSIPLGAIDRPGIYTMGYALQNAESNIRIVHDAATGANQFAEVHKLFSTCDQIAFLGFGFGTANVARLRVQDIPTATPVYGTAFGMTESEIRSYIVSKFPQFPNINREATLARSSITQFLRDRVALLS